MEIAYKTEYGILEIRPTGTLSEDDFKSMAAEFETLEKDERTLNGILINAKNFPGYESFSDMLAHAEFIAEFRDRVPKVAVCTDSAVAGLMQVIGKAFTEAEVQKFDYENRDEAEKWLLA
ncbi:MAG: STAS/SEC14 domain-containing protein [Wenzhouxiangellaceae bacterium]|nr:STAS/SEC14 domain-containing protein [Wenzhouxiangellaceae bacterium]MBS3746973.1 STAS/SEC14 domain-containing protein [Wenzhouxiangellaceae bacterium]MBS3824331.1 STAS/SEC14 domain-containing protein [Wenzhouxiangellaceae bacterium]